MKLSLAPLAALFLLACGETVERPDGVVYVNADAIDAWTIEQCFSQVPLLTYGTVRPVRVFGPGDVTVSRVGGVLAEEQRTHDLASCQRAILAFSGVALHAGPGILGAPLTTYWTDADAASFRAAGFDR